MQISTRKIEALLKDPVFSFLTDAQKKRIVHLVSIHDKLDELRDIDELVFMEADTMGTLDLRYVTPNFDSLSNEKYMNGPLQNRLKLFITDFGKSKVKQLIKERIAFFENKEAAPLKVTRSS